jgi:hypothetical protein
MKTATLDNGNVVECTCASCGQLLRMSCPNCVTTVHPKRQRQAGQRTDQVTALLVDAVINASVAEGTAYAARALHENGVPFDVALRVLTRPWHRRYHPLTQTDPYPPHAASMFHAEENQAVNT